MVSFEIWAEWVVQHHTNDGALGVVRVKSQEPK